jgi:hypothetical protein
MSKTHGLAERQTAGGGKRTRSAEAGVAGGGDLRTRHKINARFGG